ncbi:4-hydroxy-4-methyl-2-oxoglutarate aldolase (plasmid) [Azospirillum argentinense]|uniref:Putative 4-hydroxy-4-methyl-2-oxoglutarate aldolase n=2 Tax=Azospirillum argentinense TaxID=2970906 RepID=A0A2K1G1S9_9PROT|nr:4-hydroxy-4-methyl-2-oxoglutarate aldolase [Azospirillum argentinense]
MIERDRQSMTSRPDFDFPRPTPVQIAAFQGVTAATAHEAQGRRGALDSVIKPLRPGFRILGPAFPAQGQPGDNLTAHAAISFARPGDVIVYSAGGFVDGASFGDTMATAALARGLGGVVIDGAVRDAAELRKLDLPVFARGVSLRSRGDKARLGPLAQAVEVGGIRVEPGDLIIGDDDGVVVIPLADLDEVARVSREKEAKEEEFRSRFRAGGATTWDLFGAGILAKSGYRLAFTESGADIVPV